MFKEQELNLTESGEEFWVMRTQLSIQYLKKK